MLDSPVVSGVRRSLGAVVTREIYVRGSKPPFGIEKKVRGRPVGSRNTKGRESVLSPLSCSREAVIAAIRSDGRLQVTTKCIILRLRFRYHPGAIQVGVRRAMGVGTAVGKDGADVRK